MERQRAAYSTLYERFNFLLDRSLSIAEIVSKAKALIEVYPIDLEGHLQMSFFCCQECMREKNLK